MNQEDEIPTPPPQPPTEIADLPDEFLAKLKEIANFKGRSPVKDLVNKALGYPTTQREAARKKRENQPYYKEEYGRLIIPTLDRLMATQKSVFIDMRTYPGQNQNTVYAKIIQSINYVIDRMDSTLKYAEFRPKFEIKQLKGKILFEVKNLHRKAELMDFDLKEYKTFSSFEDVVVIVKFFIENGLAGQKLNIPCEGDATMEEFLPFNLSDEEVKEVQELCATVAQYGVVAMIESNSVFVGKTVKEAE